MAVHARALANVENIYNQITTNQQLTEAERGIIRDRYYGVLETLNNFFTEAVVENFANNEEFVRTQLLGRGWIQIA